jgi:hypothetical protein
LDRGLELLERKRRYLKKTAAAIKMKENQNSCTVGKEGGWG